MGDVPWEDIFKLTATTAAIEVYEGVQVGSDIYIYICNIYIYNTYIYIYIYIIVSITSLISMVSAASAAAIVHRNHFFCL